MITPWYIGYLINMFGANNITVTDISTLNEMLQGNEDYDEINKTGHCAAVDKRSTPNNG